MTPGAGYVPVRDATGTSLFFAGYAIRLGVIFNYLTLWVRVKGQG